jgi:hypothetical protein
VPCGEKMVAVGSFPIFFFRIKERRVFSGYCGPLYGRSVASVSRRSFVPLVIGTHIQTERRFVCVSTIHVDLSAAAGSRAEVVFGFLVGRQESACTAPFRCLFAGSFYLTIEPPPPPFRSYISFSSFFRWCIVCALNS